MKKYLRLGRKVLVSLSAVLVLMIACSESTNDPVFDNTVAGILVDGQGMAVPHAYIEAFQKTENFKTSNITNIFDKDTTDEDGKFELTELPDDLSQVGVRITHSDFVETNTDMETIKGENDKSNIRFVMNQRDDCVGKIEITVRDKNGTPLSEVKVKLSREGQTIRHSETNSDGKLLFENVCPGGYWLRFYKEGYTVKEDDIRVPENDPELIEFAVVLGLATEQDSCCEGSIKIYPVDEEENPITNAKVKLWQDGELLETKEVNGDGFALFENLCEGKYAFVLIAEGYKAIEFMTELGCNEDKSITKMLISDNGEKDSCCDGKIYLIIKDEVTKEVLKGAHVTIWKDGDKLDTKIVDGEYVLFENLCEGKYGFDVVLEGYKHIEFAIELGCDETKEVVKYLKGESNKDSCCDGKIYIIPKDSESGEKLKYALVRLYYNGEKIAEKRSSEGHVVFENLCEGKYGVDILVEGYKNIEFHVELGCDEVKELHKELIKENNKDSCCDGKVYIIPRDKESGHIIKGALVKLYFKDVKIGAKIVESEGVIFEELCEGAYTVVIISEGYEAVEFRFELDCNEVKEIHKDMVSNGQKDSCCDGKIYIAPKDADSGEKLRYALVRLYFNGQKIAEKKSTEGYVVFENLCEGKYGVDILAEGYKNIEFHVELGCNEVKELHKELHSEGNKDSCCNGVIHYILKDKETNKPIVEAKIRLYDSDEKVAEKYTNHDGIVVFTNVCEGKHQISSLRAGYVDFEFNFEVKCNDTLEIHRTMVPEDKDSCCTAILKIIILDKETLKPISHSKVVVEGNNFREEGTTNGDGLVVFDGLCAPREYVVIASREGYQTEDLRVEFVECNKQIKTIKLQTK